MKPGFREPIAVERTGEYDKSGRALWKLIRPLFYYSIRYERWVMVPAEFITNYASVPRLPVVYWYCGDRVYEEPALHDYPYSTGFIYLLNDPDAFVEGEEVAVRSPILKEAADELFLESLLLNPTIPNFMARVMHKAVDMFGRGSWDMLPTIHQEAAITAPVQVTEAEAP